MKFDHNCRSHVWYTRSDILAQTVSTYISQKDLKFELDENCNMNRE
jgi:hypothetical protein